MLKSLGNCDLCLSDNFDLNKLMALQKLGYHTIALNTNVDETTFEPKKKNKKGESREIVDFIPPPPELPPNLKTDMKILFRLTVELSDLNVCMKLNKSENLKKYDLLAVRPTTAVALNHACTNMDVDIISFLSESQSVVKITRKLYKQAVDKGTYFEIMYASALRDTTCRKNMIHRAHLYHSLGKSANILISSGAHNAFQVRGPYDVINLGLILGLSEQQCKNALTENARKVLLKAENRKRGKVAVFILQNSNEFLQSNQTSEENESSQMRKKIKIGNDIA